MRSTWTDSRLDEFAKRTDERFDELNGRVDGLSNRIDSLQHAMNQGLAGLLVTQI